MNVRDAIAEAGQRWIEEEGTLRALPDYVIAALCPPGGRVVVDRTAKTCPCKMNQNCPVCGGSGVVEATTTYGLEAVAGAWWNETYARRGDLVIDDDRQDGDMPLYRLVAAVALPEETPQ